jgi:hypothetical protein
MCKLGVTSCFVACYCPPFVSQTPHYKGVRKYADKYYTLRPILTETDATAQALDLLADLVEEYQISEAAVSMAIRESAASLAEKEASL